MPGSFIKPKLNYTVTGWCRKNSKELSNADLESVVFKYVDVSEFHVSTHACESIQMKFDNVYIL